MAVIIGTGLIGASIGCALTAAGLPRAPARQPGQPRSGRRRAGGGDARPARRRPGGAGGRGGAPGRHRRRRRRQPGALPAGDRDRCRLSQGRRPGRPLAAKGRPGPVRGVASHGGFAALRPGHCSSRPLRRSQLGGDPAPALGAGLGRGGPVRRAGLPGPRGDHGRRRPRRRGRAGLPPAAPAVRTDGRAPGHRPRTAICCSPGRVCATSPASPAAIPDCGSRLSAPTRPPCSTSCGGSPTSWIC